MSFNFNLKIDRDFIISMYDEDYTYISEVFVTILDQLIPDIEKASNSFQNRDLEGLRKQIHKIKPAFGFAGLRDTEEVCQQFEDSCQTVVSTDALGEKYERLIVILEESCKIIQQEVEKLKAHNN